jgi:DNA-binding transcriptional MerR regulator
MLDNSDEPTDRYLHHHTAARATAGSGGERDPDDGLFGIAEVAAELGITTRTIRFYEQKGLISLQRINRARALTKRDRARLALILRARAIGSSLDEIAHYLELYGQHGEGRSRQLRYVIDRTQDAITDLESRRAKIDSLLADLREIHQTSVAHLTALQAKP